MLPAPDLTISGVARRRVPLPRAPEPPPPARFPVFAAFAPVLASLAMWAVTRSVLALAFAALGPVIAVATTADSRLQHRRARRAQSAAFAAELARAREAILGIHTDERTALDRRRPAASELAEDLPHDTRRWRSSLAAAVFVRIGRGETASPIDLDDGGVATRDGADAALVALRALAARVPDAPLIVDARAGIGFSGAPHFALAAARGVELQLATFLSPAETTVSTAELADARTVTYSGLGAGPSATVATASSVAALPRDVGIVIEIDATGAGVLVRAPDAFAAGPVALEFVSLETATRASATLAECAAREGVRAAGAAALPDEVDLAGLPGESSTSTLRCAVGSARLVRSSSIS